MNVFDKISNFLKESWLEAKKVNWPNKNEVLRYTVLVIVVSVILALFLGGTDFLFTKLLNWVILRK